MPTPDGGDPVRAALEALAGDMIGSAPLDETRHQRIYRVDDTTAETQWVAFARPEEPS